MAAKWLKNEGQLHFNSNNFGNSTESLGVTSASQSLGLHLPHCSLEPHGDERGQGERAGQGDRCAALLSGLGRALSRRRDRAGASSRERNLVAAAGVGGGTPAHNPPSSSASNSASNAM